MIKPAAIYARVSADPEGRALGVQRQIEDCRALAASHGYEVGRVYEENDVSASTNSRRPRPLYNEMLAAARAGQYGAVIAYSNSRLTRRPREVEDLIELHVLHGTRLMTVASGIDDLDTADGRMAARLKASIDAAEAERTSERARRAKRQAAEQGKHRGGPRPFGWEPDGMTLVPVEAELIRDAARGIMEGRTLAGLARAMNDAGARTTTGRAWTYGALRTMLCRPRNAGLVSHGKADRPGMEIVGTAAWPAILSEDVWRAVFDTLTNPARKLQRGNEKRWLGSGLYQCGACQNPATGSLRVAPYRAADGSQRRLYRCTTSAHLTVSQTVADDEVLAAVGARLALPNLASVLRVEMAEPTAGLRDVRNELHARLAVFDHDYASGHISGAQLARATARVQAELDRVNAALSRSAERSVLAEFVGTPSPADEFATASLDTKRAIIDALGVVTIMPTGRGHAPSPRGRVRIEWRHDAEAEA